jgi:hypothetical protein
VKAVELAAATIEINNMNPLAVAAASLIIETESAVINTALSTGRLPVVRGDDQIWAQPTGRTRRGRSRLYDELSQSGLAF